MPFFKDLSLAPPDPIYGLMEAFKADLREGKENLGIGIYLDETKKVPLMGAVREAENILVDKGEGKVYLPIDGNQDYLAAVGKLVFGEDFWKGHQSRISRLQTLGGTGALRLGADFLKERNFGPLLYSDPTWANHKKIFGPVQLSSTAYPYFDWEQLNFNFESMKMFLSKQKEKSIVLLHTCCHNPTGADIGREEWKEICDMCEKKKLLPFFDFAYLGFGEGIEEDPWVVRYFAQKGVPLFVAFSASKTFGLYGERVGAFYYLAQDDEEARCMTSQLKLIVRARYSSPPIHGAAIVAKILNAPDLKRKWVEELNHMRTRIDAMRTQLQHALSKELPNKNFDHLAGKKGMFSFLGLQEGQVEKLRADYAIYMTKDSRVNISGLIEQNVDKVVSAIGSVC